MADRGMETGIYEDLVTSTATYVSHEGTRPMGTV
jgi:hypothetical protein